MNVYLDYAATAPLLPEVLDAMLPVLKETFGNPDSLHAYGRRAAACVTAARDEVASLLGVHPNEVYFTSGGTEADNWAMRRMGKGKAVCSAVEHAAVLEAAKERESVSCPVGQNGVVRLGELGRLAEGAGLVAVMAVNNETGCVQPVREIADLAHACGALFFCDCVQAACTQDLRAIAACADGLSLSAHKMGGPKGAGVLVVKRGVPLRPLLFGGEQERGLRAGTVNAAGAVGLACALSRAVARREWFCAHTAALRERFEQRILCGAGDRVRIDGERRAPNISHITFAQGGEYLLSALDLKGVAASGGAACSAHAALPSHVLRAMGRSEEEARRGVRFSFGAETTEEEADFAASAVLECISG